MALDFEQYLRLGDTSASYVLCIIFCTVLYYASYLNIFET